MGDRRHAERLPHGYRGPSDTQRQRLPGPAGRPCGILPDRKPPAAGERLGAPESAPAGRPPAGAARLAHRSRESRGRGVRHHQHGQPGTDPGRGPGPSRRVQPAAHAGFPEPG